MKFSAVILPSLFASVLAGPVVRDIVKRQEPNRNEVYIESVGYNGSGCPSGSASVNLAGDRKSVTILLDQYFAEAAPGLRPSDARKNCQINFALHYPQGFQYSVLASDYRGYLRLDKNIDATQRALYYFSGETQQASTSTTFTGPYDDNYLIHDEIPFTSTVWSPCGRTAALNINSEVRVNNSRNRNGSGLITNDSQDHKVTYIVGVRWQRC
jgi:hypothetical protein